MTSRLQTEIKQTKPFGRAEREAMLGVLRTAAVLDHAINETLKPHGLTSTQHNVLRILRGAEPTGLCGRDVGERLIASVPDVSRLLDRMEEMGLVSRQRDPGDRRHVTARITEKGLELVARVEPLLAAVERRWFGGLAPGEVQALVAALDTVRASG